MRPPEPLAWLLATEIALLLGACSWSVAATYIASLSEQGADLRARWMGFQQFLDATKPSANLDDCERLLPFAVAISNLDAFIFSYDPSGKWFPDWLKSIKKITL